MDTQTFLILALTVVGALAWSVRRTLSRSPGLDNLPGPPSPSWLKGMTPLFHILWLLIASAIAGNIEQFMGRHSDEWNRQNAETYGPLSRLAGPYAVSNGIPHLFGPYA